MTANVSARGSRAMLGEPLSQQPAAPVNRWPWFRERCQGGHRDARAAGVAGALPAPVVDSHCHLDVTQAVSGLPPAEALERAGRVGVTRIVQIGCDVQGSRWAVSAAERWPNVIAG